MLDGLIAEARQRFGLDLGDGLQVITPEHLASFPLEPSRAAILVPLAALLGDREDISADTAALPPLPGRHRGHSEALAVLGRLYPPEHRVERLGGAQLGGQAGQDGHEGPRLADLTEADLGEPIYLPPLAPQDALATPWALPWIANRLRRRDGCPWDREQTHQSLRKHVLEEAYEVYDALEAGATPALADELGDLLLQIVLHAQLAAETGTFDMTDVYQAIGTKIVRRHPHVFGEAEVHTASDVNRQWERIKADERRAAAGAEEGENGAAPPARSALDGISTSMPALAATQEMQERAAHLGYDWPTVDGIVAKLHEELAELREARTPAERYEEMGDLLLVAVNLARRQGVEAEAALRAAGEKFRRRFRSVERQAAERGVALRDLDFDQLDALWRAAKAEEMTA